MTAPVVTMGDGPRLTVSDLVGNPLWVPTKIKELMENQFISEALFRNAGANSNGIVAYTEGDPMFLDGDVQDIAERGEIPIAIGRRGTPVVVYANKRGLGVGVSLEMIRENKIGQVQYQITQLTNTFTRADDKVARSLLQSSAVPSLAITNDWDGVSGNPRLDIATAIRQIADAAPSIASAEESYGFQADTIVMNPGLLPTLLDNDKFLKIYNGNVASEHPAFKGAIPSQILGLDVILSKAWPLREVCVLQRGVVGFYSDTWPLEITGLYPEGNGPLGGPTQTWRCDATHKRAIALDQPKAAYRLTGVLA